MEFELQDCDNCTKNNYSLGCVPVLSNELTYNEFFRNFLEPNIPCIIQNVTDMWEANFKWLIDEKKPNIAYLKSKYGSCDVCIYNCNERYFNSQKTECCKLTKFLESWGSEQSKFKYLKDWHLKNTVKNDEFYQVPIFFASDWLNEFLTDKNEDDYRFVYMGQAECYFSRTPFHADVFNSYSWSANICGKKRWILFPPGEERFLMDSLNNLPYDISDTYKNRKHFEIIQHQGEAIFIPSGWYHQVWNLEDTISVNHNWVNGCNVTNMWSCMEENLSSVKKELQDCHDIENFEQQCQIVLKASFGFDFFNFFEFLKFVIKRRKSQIMAQEVKKLFHTHSLGLNHANYDLKVAKSVLETFLKHSDIPSLVQFSNLQMDELFL